MPRIKFFVFTISLLSLLFYPSCNGNGDSSTETNVTFRVDMSNETVSTNGVHIAGTMQSADGSVEEMLDADDDGVYEVTLSCTIGDTVQYIYLNSNVLGGPTEVLDTLSCALSGTGNRWMEVPDTDSLTLDIVCYNSCTACVDTSTTDGGTLSLENLHIFRGLWGLENVCEIIPDSIYLNDTTWLIFPDSGAYFTFGDWEGVCDSVAEDCYFTATFDIGLDSSGQVYTYSFANEDGDTFYVYFTLALGVENLDYFIFDPNYLTISYYISPLYSYPGKTEVYSKLNDDFDNLPDVFPDFTPVCSGMFWVGSVSRFAFPSI